MSASTFAVSDAMGAGSETDDCIAQRKAMTVELSSVPPLYQVEDRVLSDCLFVCLFSC